MRIIAYQIGQDTRTVGIKESTGDCVESDNIMKLLGFLVEDYGESLRVCWTLDTTVAPLLKMLGEKRCRTLYETKKLHIPPYSIFYIPSKVFSVKHIPTRLQCNLYGIDQYFQDYPEPADINDVYNFGRMLWEELKAMGMRPTKLTSPAAIYEQCVLRFLDKPTVKDLPPVVGEYAWRCSGKVWVEAHKLGYWDKAYDYDIACYSSDTDALTMAGWKPIVGLNTGDVILTFNKKDNKCRFQPILKMHKSYYDGDLINIKTKTKLDLLVTPNHTVLYKDRMRCKQALSYKKGIPLGTLTGWKVKRADELPNGNIVVPVSFPMADKGDYPVSDTLLKLLGWINTEGWRRMWKGVGGGICISQSKTYNLNNCRKINRLLDKSGLKHSIITRHRKYKGRPYTELVFVIHARDARKYIDPLLDYEDIHYIPLWVLQNCSKKQLRMYFDVLIMGDGANKPPNSCTYFTKHIVNSDRMMYLCALLGKKANQGERQNNNGPGYMVFITNYTGGKRKTDYVNTIQFRAIKRVKYNGYVACPTTNDGFIVVRRNGKLGISGNSAFPSVVANLYDIRNCEIIHSNKYQENALYGYCKGIVNIYDEVKVSPIIRVDEKGNSSSPTGTWPDYLTKNDMKFIKDWDIGRFDILDGHWLFAKKLTQPMKNVTERLLRYKVNGGLRADIAKAMSVGGLYGKLGEDRITEFGPHFNPAWFAQVSTEIRIEDAEFIYRNHLQDNLIHVSVDGILSDKKVELKGNGEAGEWRLSQESPALVLSSGLVYLENRMPKGLTLDEILDMFNAHPNTGYYERILPGRVTLGEALEADRLKDVGRLVDKRTSIDFLRQHHDREFKKVPMTGRQVLSNCYDSVPYKVREVVVV